MGLDNKLDGDRLWAFEVNNISKGLRLLWKSITSLNTRWSYKGSTGFSSSNNVIDVPKSCNFAMLKYTVTNSSVSGGGVLFVAREGLTLATAKEFGNIGSYQTATINATWSGDTITVSGNSPSGTCYFY